VQARGGRITAASHPSGGTIFAVELPVARAGASPWPRLHLAPVLSHSALAGARAALEVHVREGWQVLHWERGIFTVEVKADVLTVETAAARIAASTSFACWRDT
ncbi:MAG TPA: hypothetical protein VGW38_29525, partial [Chloroflexota bacterium]|nr:hypothetical protein [Chloroflexota bacterium]